MGRAASWVLLPILFWCRITGSDVSYHKLLLTEEWYQSGGWGRKPPAVLLLLSVPGGCKVACSRTGYAGNEWPAQHRDMLADVRLALHRRASLAGVRNRPLTVGESKACLFS